jgi:hypothetical protein
MLAVVTGGQTVPPCGTVSVEPATRGERVLQELHDIGIRVGGVVPVLRLVTVAAARGGMERGTTGQVDVGYRRRRGRNTELPSSPDCPAGLRWCWLEGFTLPSVNVTAKGARQLAKELSRGVF